MAGILCYRRRRGRYQKRRRSILTIIWDIDISIGVELRSCTNSSLPKYCRKKRKRSKKHHLRNRRGSRNLNRILSNSKKHIILSCPKCLPPGTISRRNKRSDAIINWVFICIMGCCCLSKQKRSKPKAQATVPNAEVPQAKQEPMPEYAKMWLEHEPSDGKIKEQPMEHVEASPPPPSKRRQLLKDLFKEAKQKQEKQEKQPEKRSRSPLFKIQKMETMDSASSAVEQKSKSHMGIEQAIRQMVRQNKQQLTCCGLCTETYTTQRQPMMLCMNQHTFCSQCINDLWKKGYRRCPLDQNPYDIANIQKNRFILSILEQMK